jgi:hypothetical protein
MKRSLSILFFLALGGFGETCLAQELGRLFFTPEQRQALDQRRRARVPDRPNVPVVVSPTTRMDGYVHRSGGKSTVFVNGEPIPESAPEAPRIGGGRATVNVGETGARTGLKPGEVLDRGTGEVRDVVREGEVRIRRSE